MNRLRSKELIPKLELTQHPEGGWFKETYRSQQKLSSPVHGGTRSSLTDIHFMLEQGQISRFHRVEHDEVWYWHEGADLELILWNADEIANAPEVITIGSLLAESSHQESIANLEPLIESNKFYKFTVPAGFWQAAQPKGEYALVSCAVAPGFDFEDFRFMNIQESEEFQILHPEYIDFI